MMSANVLNIHDITELSKVMKERFFKKIDSKSYFRLTSTPESFSEINIDIQSDEVLNLLKNPPVTRDAGWNAKVAGDFKPNHEGIKNEEYTWRHLLLLKNGHLEFWTAINESFCWMQNEQEMKIHPRLYPYAVTEYPVNFFRLLKHMIRILNVQSKMFITGGYYNCRGCYLRPGHPESTMFQNYNLYKPRYWENDSSVEFREKWIPFDFDPDLEAYNLVVETYEAFEIEKKYIPFFDDNKKFTLG